MILTKMNQIAKNFLCREVKNVVISAFAYFNDNQKQSTKDAEIIAGLNVLRIIFLMGWIKNNKNRIYKS